MQFCPSTQNKQSEEASHTLGAHFHTLPVHRPITRHSPNKVLELISRPFFLFCLYANWPAAVHENNRLIVSFLMCVYTVLARNPKWAKKSLSTLEQCTHNYGEYLFCVYFCNVYRLDYVAFHALMVTQFFFAWLLAARLYNPFFVIYLLLLILICALQ